MKWFRREKAGSNRVEPRADSSLTVWIAVRDFYIFFDSLFSIKFVLKGRRKRMGEQKAYQHKVQYYETDQMGIVHHSNYIRWFEEARTDYMGTAWHRL